MATVKAIEAIGKPDGGPLRPDFDKVIANVLVNGALQEVFVTTRVG